MDGDPIINSFEFEHGEVASEAEIDTNCVVPMQQGFFADNSQPESHNLTCTARHLEPMTCTPNNHDGSDITPPGNKLTEVILNKDINSDDTFHIKPKAVVTVKIETSEDYDKAFAQSDILYRDTNIPDNSLPEHSYCFPSNKQRNFEFDCETSVNVSDMNNHSDAVVHVKQEETDDGFQNGFVSSMIEVVDNVGANVKNAVESSSSDSDGYSSSEDSDSSDSSTSTDTSSDDSCLFRIRHEDIELAEEVAALKNSEPPKVKGEITSSELPPVEDLNICLPGDTILEAIGKVSQIMPDHSIVIKSYEGKPALDFKTVLFFARDLAFGVVEETFGPVPSPYYVIRFNNPEHIVSKGVVLEREAFYAPHIKDFTSFVFVSQLQKLRGSDASWSNDQEPPPACLDYSDDEQEREARRQRKNQARANQSEENRETSASTVRNDETRQSTNRGRGRGRGRGRKRDHWHNQSTVRMNQPDPSQTGWQNAVSRPQRNPNPNNMPSLTTLFNEPPPPPPPHHFPPPIMFPRGPMMNDDANAINSFQQPGFPNMPPPPLGNFQYDHRPPPFMNMNWEQNNFQQSMFPYQQPPPPPPPPP